MGLKEKYGWVATELRLIAGDIDDEHGGYLSIHQSIMNLLDKMEHERACNVFLKK